MGSLREIDECVRIVDFIRHRAIVECLGSSGIQAHLSRESRPGSDELPYHADLSGKPRGCTSMGHFRYFHTKLFIQPRLTTPIQAKSVEQISTATSCTFSPNTIHIWLGNSFSLPIWLRPTSDFRLAAFFSAVSTTNSPQVTPCLMDMLMA
ncbi:hypothetical protein BV22DRAFT_495567 [Leucogyrophana mollusca]|uniref:Uncharacterized protein n=1 Tax=Leucogyrophana mollusca TaxID=85980 RepID=A0ACB8BGV4_9AGAM|nr:hypothetical protein BV22DRAFT_495567 [Leucogyrophana mollusca]